MRWLVAAAALAVAAPANAQSRSVLVLSTGAEDERGLIDALAIQLEGTGRAERGPTLAPGSLAERLDAAVDRVAERGAMLGVWIEPIEADAGGGVVLHVVRGDRERALLEVVRVGAAPGDPAAVLHRELALRIAGILDLVEARNGELAAAIAEPADARALAPVLAAGVVATSGRLGPSAGAQIAGGVEIDRRAWSLEARAVLRALAETDHPSDAGRVSIQETAGAIDARIGVGGELAAALGLELSLRRLAATGVAPWDETGTATRWVPAARAVVEGTLWLAPAIGVRVGAAGELSFVHQRFAVAGQPAADLGRFRFSTAGELVLRFR